MNRIFLALAMMAVTALPCHAGDTIQQQMTVEEAYSAIPHEKTRFDAAAANMSGTEKEFLDIFFGLTDFAVAERVIEQRGGNSDNYDAILGRLAALQVPEKLSQAHALVVDAIGQQRDYIKKLKSGGRFDSSDPLVQGSHNKLIAAYGELMRAYPSEGPHNKKAFYDHLCALDFI
jgi:hypothetical protein